MLLLLSDRRTCHSAVYTAAGWISPVDKLIETGQIHVDDRDVYFNVGEFVFLWFIHWSSCWRRQPRELLFSGKIHRSCSNSSPRKFAVKFLLSGQFFSKSCVPGSLNDYYNTKGTNPINLCEACAAGPPDRCQRNQEELYYGNSGAFRCLTESKWQVVLFCSDEYVGQHAEFRHCPMGCQDCTSTNCQAEKERQFLTVFLQRVVTWPLWSTRQCGRIQMVVTRPSGHVTDAQMTMNCCATTAPGVT